MTPVSLPDRSSPYSDGMAQVLTIELELAASPAVIWRFLTEPALLGSWFWPARLEPVVELDPQVGGTYRISSEAADLAVSGWILEVIAREQLQVTWRWDGEPEETQVTVQLRATRPGFSRLLLHHSGHDSAAAADRHRQGWTDCLERLRERLENEAAVRLRAEQRILELVSEAMDRGGLVLSEQSLAAEFFDLRSGLLGELFQKFSNYQLKLALVLQQPERHGERMVELVREHQRHPDLRFFPDPVSAEAWLAESAQLS